MHQSLRQKACGLVLAGLLLGGCATAPPLSSKVEQLPERVELSEVPFFPRPSTNVVQPHWRPCSISGA